MKKYSLLISVLIIVAIIILAIVIPQRHQQSSSAEVAATIFPIYDITQSIAGDDVHVTLILDPGVSTHTYEPTTEKLRTLTDVKVVYAIGEGLDDWVDTITNSVQAEKVTLEPGIELRGSEEEEEHEHEEDHEEDEDHDANQDEEEHGHSHDGDDPHYWLTIPNAKIIAKTIAEDLSDRYPEYSENFEKNLATYLTELEAADQEIRQIVAEAENQEIVTMHDAWYYFAEEYGFEVVGTFEPTAGREPTPQYISALIETVEEHHLTTLFSEPQISTDSIQTIANDLGVTIRVLDPIGGIDERQSYIDLMIYNAKTISQN